MITYYIVRSKARDMIEAVLSIKLYGIWHTELVKKFPIEIRILDIIPYGTDGIQDLVEIKLNDQNIDEITKFIESVAEVEEVNIEHVDASKAIGIVKTKMCYGCKALLECDCFLISSVTTQDERVEWTLFASDRDKLKNLVDELDKQDAQPKLVKLTSIKEDELLTDRQEKIVKTAYDRGYYDFPKRIGVKELAEMFEVSTATLSEILRRGQKKIIETYFEKQ